MARGRGQGYEEQRAQILREAARLFAQQGYAGTSMSEIAAACGLSKAAVYHYFDKYRLLVSIAEGHVDRLNQALSGVLAGDDVGPGGASDGQVGDEAAGPAGQHQDARRLRLLIERIIIEYADAQDAHRVLTEDVRYLEQADRRRILDKERALVDRFSDTIARWRPDHARAGLAMPLTMLLFGSVNWMFTWLKPGGRLSHSQMAPLVADLFLAGIPAVSPAVGPAVGPPAAPHRAGPTNSESR